MNKYRFYQELTAKLMENEKVEITFPGMQSPLEEAVEARCFTLLWKIKEVIDDDSLDDPECFQKIEAIIQLLEDAGSGGGLRHDFG